MRVLMLTPPLHHPKESGRLAPLVRQIDSLRQAGARVEVMEVLGIARLKYPLSVPRVRARAASADLVHAHFGYCGWLARSQLAKPVVVSFMGTDLLGSPNADGHLKPYSHWLIRADRLLAALVNAVIVKSAQMARVIAPVPAHVIPNGVDLALFRPMDPGEARARLGWPEGKRHVLFPGCPVNPRKGFALATAAVTEAMALAPGSVGLVPLWGVPPERVPLFLNASDAMLLTSFSEGSPNVVKEAMACNLPVVSVPVGDVPELLAGVSGCAVRPRDAGALAEALIRVLADGARTDGRVHLERRGLDLRNVARRVMGVYEATLARAWGGRHVAGGP